MTTTTPTLTSKARFRVAGGRPWTLDEKPMRIATRRCMVRDMKSFSQLAVLAALTICVLGNGASSIAKEKKTAAAAAPELLAPKEISRAQIEARLKLIPRDEGGSAETVIKFLGIDREKLDWEANMGLTSLFGPLKDEGYRIHIEARDDELREVAILDSEDHQHLVRWTPRKGIQIPEAATIDEGVKYLKHQPFSVRWSDTPEGYFPTDVAKRAVEWYDARVDAWNRSDERRGGEPRHFPARQEIKNAQDRGVTYTLRMPAGFNNDGSWGVLLDARSYYETHLPLQLRQTCDRHKLLYVSLSKDWDPPGRVWYDTAKILDWIATLKSLYTFRPNRTVLWDSTSNCQSAAVVGSLYPDTFGIIAMEWFRALPVDVPDTSDEDVFRGEAIAFPMRWMKSYDWLLNSNCGQRWGMTNGMSFSFTMLEEVKPAWVAIGIEPTMIERRRDDQPRRCEIAELVDAMLPKP